MGEIDFRNSRIYLPRDEMVAYAIGEADLAAWKVMDRWWSFIRFQIERARGLYAGAWPGVKILEREGQMEIRAASILYSVILHAIEANDYDVFSRRASLNTWLKASRLPGLAWRLQR